MKRAGFTLLELVISCAILVTVFAFAASALTRVHRLRMDSESQTRLMTEGRALLDELADELAHVAGTNLVVEYATPAGGHPMSLTLESVRYAKHPASRKNGDAYDTLPFLGHARDFYGAGDEVGVGRFLGAVDYDSALDSTTGARRVAYDLKSDGSSSVTNAYAADEMGTHIPAAAKGDTISVPVTTGSSATTYGSRTSYDGSVLVVPSAHEGTNTVMATAAFNSSHSGERTVTMRRPGWNGNGQVSPLLDVVAWPPPSTLRATVRAESVIRAEPVAENVTSNAFLVPGILEYTNAPVSAATFADAETNATVRTELEASVEGFVQETTNALPVAGQLLYGPQDGTTVVESFWTWGETATVNTNGILSGVSLVLNGGRTNTYASAADVAASATGVVTHADANFQFAEILDLLTLDLSFSPGESGGTNDMYETSSVTNEVPSVTNSVPSVTNEFPSVTNASPFTADARIYAMLTNLVSLAAPIAFTNEFAPADDSGAALPVYVSEVLSYEERATPVDFAAAFSVNSAAAGADTNGPPLTAQGYRRQLTVEIERVVTDTNVTLRIVHDWTADTSYGLRFDVPASLVPTNGSGRAYGGVVTNVFPKGTTYDSETQWHDVVLEEDFPGADERTSGIWLRVEGDRDKSKLETREEKVAIPYVKSDKNPWETSDPLTPAAWQSLRSIVVTPLCFSTNENERLSLVVWDPEDDPPGPPVCADIYVELLSSAHRLRADRMPEGEKRDKYIQDHVIRLTRRAPIGTARRDLP